MDFATISPWAVVSVLLPIVGFFLIRTLKQTDTNDDKIQDKFDELIKIVNDLRHDFTVVQTQHTDGWGDHRMCLEKIRDMEIIVQGCQRRSDGHRDD
jgi:2,3-bisphosphoglycerate-independent phosphoglycerate mutase